MIDHLVRASIDGAIAVAVVWVICRVAPRLSPSLKTWLWWCAAAKFVVALLWIAPLQLAVLPARVAAPVSALSSSVSATASLSPIVPVAIAPQSLAATLSLAVLALWGAGVIAAAGVGVSRWRRAQQLIRGATDADADTVASLAEVAAAMGLRAMPRLMVSADVETPVVVGVVRAVVIVPAARFASLDRDAQRMALAHECAHIRRADLRIGAVPAVCETVFFFHPLARLAAREYALWREAACDALVLDVIDTTPADYGRLLLDLGVSRSRVGLAAAGVSGSSSNLKRRLLMLTETPVASTRSRLVALVIIAAAALSVVPVQLTARAVVLRGEAHEAITPVRSVTPVAAPLATPAPAPAPAQREAAQAFVLIVDDGRHIMSGSNSDVHRAEALRRSGEPLLWFQRDGREYVVRDRVTVQQAIELWQTVNELGNAQGKLGAEQGALGARQGEIGERQGKIGAEQGKLGEQQAEIAQRVAELNRLAMRAKSDADRRDVEMGRQKLELEMKSISQSMNAMSSRMGESDVPMEKLSRQMNELSQKMEVLSRRMQEASAKAEADMATLIKRAIESGAAQPVR